MIVGLISTSEGHPRIGDLNEVLDNLFGSVSRKQLERDIRTLKKLGVVYLATGGPLMNNTTYAVKPGTADKVAFRQAVAALDEFLNTNYDNPFTAKELFGHVAPLIDLPMGETTILRAIGSLREKYSNRLSSRMAGPQSTYALAKP